MFSGAGGAGKAAFECVGGGVEKWRGWFSFAVLRLGLAPNAFWALTIAEWRWLIDAALTTGDALDAAALNSLSHLYPDQ